MMASDGVIFRANPLSFVAGTCYYCSNQNSQIKDHNHGRQTLPAGATSNPRDADSAVFGRLCVRAQSGASTRCVRRHAGPAGARIRACQSEQWRWSTCVQSGDATEAVSIRHSGRGAKFAPARRRDTVQWSSRGLARQL